MKRLNGGEYLLDLSNATIDDGALLGVNDEFLSLFPIVRGNLRKNRIYIKMNGFIVPCTYIISGLILTISGIFNNGTNGVVLLTIACEYDVDEYDVVSIDSISYDSIEKENINSALLEEIKDEKGHKRFVEGNGEVSIIPGVTFSYFKWALSGSHLMFVLAGECDEDTIINDGAPLVSFTLPDWVVEKIYPVWSTQIERKTTSFTASDWSTQTGDVSLQKIDNGTKIIKVGAITFTKDRAFRISFDLIIDNE